MKHRISGAVLILIILLQSAGCATTADTDFVLDESSEPEPYEVDEFPVWLQDLRRAEIIFTGSIPFTLLASTAGYSIIDLIQSAGTGASITDLTSTTTMTNDDRFVILAVSGGLSALITIADYIIGIIEDGEKTEQDNRLMKDGKTQDSIYFYLKASET